MSTANRLLPGLTLWVSILLSLVPGACATWQQPGEFDMSVLRTRAETEAVKGVKLSAAVLSSAESQMMFGADVNNTGVQPVWIEIENSTNQVLWLLRSGTDPDLFSPLEVAWSFHKSFAGKTNASLDAHFDAMSFQNPIAPGTTQSGILFTNPHRKTRLLVIDIIGQGEIFPFTLFPRVPDDETDEAATIANLHQRIQAATEDYQDADSFRARLEQFPCCATSADGNRAGDPVNVILVGELDDIATALVRRGFRMSPLAFDNTQRLFSRPPDVVVRKVGQSGAPANWLRIWVAPLRYQNQPVFLLQAGRPLGWRHAISDDQQQILNPKVDEVRNLLIQDVLYSGGVEKLAFVGGVGATEPGMSRSSLGDASYQTDGLRAVVFIATRPLSLSDVELLDWHPLLKLREAEVINRHENQPSKKTD